MNLNLVVPSLLIVFIKSLVVSQTCNICAVSSGFACFSESQYFLCDADGALDLSSLTSCASGYCAASTATGSTPCSTDAPDCPFPPVPTQIPTTSAPTTVVATTEPTTTVTTSITSTSESSSVQTTSTTTSETTTLPFNGTTFCAALAVGRYSYGNNCTQYVYCYANGGLKGAIYSCVGKTLFNQTTQTCQLGSVC